MPLLMTTADLRAFMARDFAEVDDQLYVEQASDDALILRLRVDARHLRPGGTVSGPAIFLLADVAMYLAILAQIGPKALTVTTNTSIDFMRKPAAGVDLLATAQVLKLGRHLAVGDVMIRSAGQTAIVARAGLTYAIPPTA